MVNPKSRSILSFHKLVFCLILAGFAGVDLSAADGDIEHVISHERMLVVTDPTTGSNSYAKWVQFPEEGEQYRKVTLWITYACPESLHCGEWDYIDKVMLRRSVGDSDSVKNLELARMISPYGWRFDSDWEFTWHIDITDFALLLHDSVEIEFVHTGYESNSDRGWLVTLDFEIELGRPAMKCLGMDTLWCGSFPYGDSASDIEDLLHPLKFSAPIGSEYARLRIHQTGHGMDDLENCAEFCAKYRRVIFDDSLINERILWRECGENPLYPQAGTWIFDRSNWCPGGVVYPDIYDLPTGDTETHEIDIAMEPYVNLNEPTANWYIHSYLFYYDDPAAVNDVSVEMITSPSDLDEYSRTNPACDQLRFIMKNNGSDPIQSVDVFYGIAGQEERSFTWTGHLASQERESVSRSVYLQTSERQDSVYVRLEAPNGRADEYPHDNIAYSLASPVPVYPISFILELRTNRDAGETSYRVSDASGVAVYERELGSLLAHTTYFDTLSFEPGCYRLEVADTSGDGLELWFNPDAGRGYLRIMDMDGHLIREFNSDFGNSIEHCFMASSKSRLSEVDSAVCLVHPFPPRNDGKFEVDVFFNEPEQAVLRVESEDSDSTILKRELTDFKSGFVPVDISAEPDGIYRVIVEADGMEEARRIRVKR